MFVPIDNCICSSLSFWCSENAPGVLKMFLLGLGLLEMVFPLVEEDLEALLPSRWWEPRSWRSGSGSECCPWPPLRQRDGKWVKFGEIWHLCLMLHHLQDSQALRDEYKSLQKIWPKNANKFGLTSVDSSWPLYFAFWCKMGFFSPPHNGSVQWWKSRK